MTPRPIRPGRLRAGAMLLALVWTLAACGSVAPSATSAPSAPSTPAASAPVASDGATPFPLPSIDLGGEIAPEAVTRHLEALARIASDNGGIRTSGTPGYEASVEYVAGELRAIGWVVETPEFRLPTFRELPGATLQVVGGPTFTAGDDLHAMIYSADGEVTAEVATVGFEDSAGGRGDQGCDADDWDEFPAGSIALTPPGPCLRRDTVEHAQEAGAVGLVVANPAWEAGEALRPTLLFPDGIGIPVISAIGEVGEALEDVADDGTEVRISVDTEIGTATVRNVVAQHGGDGPVVMLGAHLDSVLDGPGLNDNGSGVAAVLEIAHLLADAGHPGTIRVALWAGEEFGLHGSRAYATGGNLGDVAAYLNLDMLGSVNGVPMVYRNSGSPQGSQAISDFLIAWLRQAGVPAEPEDLGTGSDHYFFAEAGIPIGGIFSGATEEVSEEQAAATGGSQGDPMDPCYHRSCDTVGNVDAERVAVYAQAAAAAAALLAGGELPGAQ
ncbi:MAG TPA: M20/M25/M40 family metallo-hydrolase [Candidatus Limnocylindria bacterium]